MVTKRSLSPDDAPVRRPFGGLLADGLYAGLVGYATVVLFYLVADPLAGRRLFHTPALLGSVLFFGLDDPAELVIAPGPVFAYNGAHMVVFIGLGMVAAAFALLARYGPGLWYLGLSLFFFVLLHVFGAFLFLTERVRAALPVWTLVVATTFAVSLMAAYLVWVHIGLHAGGEGGARTKTSGT